VLLLDTWEFRALVLAGWSGGFDGKRLNSKEEAEMALTQLADTVQTIREDEKAREAIAAGETELLGSFTEEERQALQDLARRVSSGQGIPKHQERSKSILRWL